MKATTPIAAFTLFAAAISLTLSAQSQPSKLRAQKNIVWLTPGTEYYEGNYSVTYLRFEGAVFDKAFTPYYKEKIAVSSSTQQVRAEIKDAVFLPVEEISLLEKFKDKISNSITAEAQIAYERNHPYAIVSFLPFRKNPVTGIFEKLVSFNITINETGGAERAAPVSSFITSSVLASGDWYKISVAKDGVYKIDYQFLKSLGIDVDQVNPSFIRIYGNGGGMLPFANSAPRRDDLAENAIYVSGESDGHFNTDDYILFYGQGQIRWKYDAANNIFHHVDNYYSDSTYYFISTGMGPGQRISMQQSSTLPATNVVTTFNDYALHEVDLTNCVKSGKEWYGESFDPSVNTARNFAFVFPNISTSSPVCLRSDIAAHSVNPPYPASGFNVFANGQPVLAQLAPTVGNYYFAACSGEVYDDTCFSVSSDDVNINMVFNGSYSGASGQLNYLELNAKRNLTMFGNQMTFRNASNIAAGNVAEYTLSSINATTKIWDVTNPVHVAEQEVSVSASSYTFRLPNDSMREFIAFNGSNFPAPQAIGKIENQDLHSIASAEMVIVTHPLFLQQAERLAEHHRNHDSLTVSIVTTFQIYNEFSSGAQDVSAIRDFMRMLYERNLSGGTAPRYLLLFGDGSYDNKHRLSANTDYVVTYQSDNSLDPTSTYISDDFFGFLDPNEGYWPENSTALLEIGIGRFPVKTTAEAEAVVNKTINYALNGSNGNISQCDAGNTGFGEWRNIVTFVGDDEDSNTHFTQAQQLSAKVDTGYPEYNIEKIYLDAYVQTSTVGGERYEGAEEALKNRVQRGTLLLTYIGHGGEVGLAHERVLSVETINNWTNFNRLGAFLTATCEFARVDDPERNSAGEFVLLNANGGGVVLFTTTRLAFSGSNFQLSRKFFDYVFEPINGSMPAVGDIQRLTKNGYLDSNVRNFVLLGDPALKLAYPRWNVVTTAINNHPINLAADTAKGLNKVTVSGEVRDNNGQLMSGYNGTLIASVYDKYATLYTLANDPSSSVAAFKVRKNILFKGKATIQNGQFNYTFVLPKDIAPLYDKGKISYYAYNGVTDANGYFDNLIIGGGYDTSAANDNAGPEIKLYMNDDKFISGGITNANPVVYANVSDTSGINTSGNGIGHDITINLDNDPERLFNANDYFECDFNSYQKGKVLFPLTGLADGKHTVEMKVWDSFNNSSKSSVDFYVNSSKDVVLEHVYNYPNPFTTKTSFMFEHNQACVPMSVQVQILTVTGKLIKTITQNVTCDGFRYDKIEWDGRDDYGDKIGRGVYIYRLRVKTEDGYTADKMEKLVKL
jgi:hypothetical protein